MGVSVVLNSLPAERDLWHSYVEHLRGIPGIEECRVALPAADTSSREEDLDGVFALKDDFFKVWQPVEELNVAQRLNLVAAEATEETLLFLERPFWLTLAKDRDTNWYRLRSPRGLKHIGRFIAESTRGSEEPDASSSLLPLSEERLGQAVLIEKKHFLEMRGYDERDEICPSLGFDFSLRQKRGGFDVEKPTKRVQALLLNDEYQNEQESETKAKSVALASHTLYRNLEEWSVPQALREPLVTVAIATKDRHDMLIESINSVRYQSFQEFEIVVVDDGSEDQQRVQALVSELNDPRITFVAHPESLGVAAARNTAAQHSRCLLTAVHDDDDLMLPDRLLDGISPLSDTVDATYGSWINFDDATGELRGFLTRVGFDENMIAFNGAGPGHSTWTVPTWLIKQFGYDERLTSSVDHELASRLMNSGVRWLHVQKFMYLRRVHDLQITAQDTDNQKAGHTLSKLANRFLTSKRGFEQMASAGKSHGYPSTPGTSNLHLNFGGYLPDHLVKRDLVFAGNTVTKARAADMPERVTTILTGRDLQTGKALFEEATLENVSQLDLVTLREIGVNSFSVKPSELLVAGDEAQAPDSPDDFAAIENDVLARVRKAVLERLLRAAEQAKRQNSKLHFVVVDLDGDSRISEEELATTNQKLLLRFVGTGEFGVNTKKYLVGYESSQEAVEALGDFTERFSQAEVLLLNESPRDFLAAFLAAREREGLLASIDDSGLVGM